MSRSALKSLLPLSALATVFLAPAPVLAQTGRYYNPNGPFVAKDDASNYGGANQPSFTDGSNGGTGFGAWKLSTSGASGGAGFYLYTSTQNGNGGGTGIDTGGQSFGLYANGYPNSATATRSFNSDMTAGETFSMSFDNGNFDKNGSYDDFLLGNGNLNQNAVFKFQFTGGNTSYTFSVDGVDVSPSGPALGFTSGGLKTSLTLLDATHYSFTATSSTDPSQTATWSGQFSGNAINQVIVQNASAGSGEQYNFYVNNLSLETPAPPGVIAAFEGIGVIGFGAIFQRLRRRRSKLVSVEA